MEKLQDFLSNALQEKWSFPSSQFTESVERHHAPAEKFGLETINEMLRRAADMRKSRALTISASEKALPKPSEKLDSKPVLYWLVSVNDPVSSVIADARDSYNISINAMLNQKSVEISSRLQTVPDQKIQESAGGLVKRKRPSSVQDAILALKDPACDPTGEGRWATAASCVALGVGLVVETPDFADVVCWGPQMAWISAGGGFARMSERDVASKLREMAAGLVNSADPSMGALKGACVCLKVAKPYKRSRIGMVTDIKAKLNELGQK